jgi:hypothetical protein
VDTVKVTALLQRIPKSVKMVILIVILSKLLIFSVGYAETYVSNPQYIYNTPQGNVPSTPINIIMYEFAKPLAPHDTYHYLYIAQYGYDGNSSDDQYNFIVFFPLYPALIHLITFDYSYVNLSALIVSNVSSAIALFYLFKLTKLDYDDGVAQKAVLFLSIFPTAYFLSIPYTEGLFFVLVIASLYYGRLGKWPLAGSLAFFAALTRLGGLLMLPVLLVEYLHQKGWKPRKIVNLNLLWIFFALAGFLVYLGINYQVTGDAFKFVEIERVHWFSTLDPILGLTRAYGYAVSWDFPNNLLLGIAPIGFAVFGLVMVITGVVMGFKHRFRPSYILYMLLSWMLAVAYSFWISPPRYVMAMFPMFILLGLLTRKKIVNIAIAVFFGVLLCYFTALWSLGYLVF